MDGDFDLFDGYDEISSENQEKIREAVEQGHVADSDWKGVSKLISSEDKFSDRFYVGCGGEPSWKDRIPSTGLKESKG